MMQDLKKLTEQLMKTYMNSDSMKSLTIGDFLENSSSFIGTGKEEFFKEMGSFLNSFSFDAEKRETLHLAFTNFQMEERQMNDTCAYVFGTATIEGKNSDGIPLVCVDTRFTIIYECIHGKWKVMHIHHSVPDKEQLEGEEFPLSLGKQIQKVRHEVEALSAAYSQIALVDLTTMEIELLKNYDAYNCLLGEHVLEKDSIFLRVKDVVLEPYLDKYLDFIDMYTVAERLKGKDSLSFVFKKKDDKWVHSMIVPQSYDSEGNVISVLVANHDVTKETEEKLEQEEELRKAKLEAEKANKAKSTFLFNMSHDIRTPMNAIVGYSALMKKALTDPKLVHYEEMIEQSSYLLLSILNNVLDVARIESGKLTLEENLNEMGRLSEKICNSFQAEANKKGIEISKTVSVEHPYILADTTKVQEVLSNLVSNAIKYTPEGGKVSICIEELPYDRQGYTLIQTTISDTGIGMSKEFVPHLFESFAREKEMRESAIQGTGLGMAIVKSYVELMDGSITVKSELGKGSTFTLKIPHKLADKSYYEIEELGSDTQMLMDFTGKHILLAEDNALNAEITMTILSEMGFEVDVAKDGAVCVELFKTQPSGTYDVILMDIQMPNMDGYQATKCIRALAESKKANIPIIGMSANAFAEDRKRALEMQMNEYITKPVDFKKMKKILYDVVSHHAEA